LANHLSNAYACTHSNLDGNYLICEEIAKTFVSQVIRRACFQNSQKQRPLLTGRLLLVIFLTVPAVLLIVVAALLIYMRVLHRRLKLMPNEKQPLIQQMVSKVAGLIEYAPDDESLGVAITPTVLTFGTAA
jgi:F0F1-type ATP synthase membrane subunit a